MIHDLLKNKIEVNLIFSSSSCQRNLFQTIFRVMIDNGAIFISAAVQTKSKQENEILQNSKN